MLCDDFRDQFLAGGPLKGPLEGHLAACPSCRDEFAFVGALRASPPSPSGALRDRVLMSFPRPNRWRIVAWAASLLLAGGAGFAVGAVKPPVEVPVERTVEREVKVPIDRIVERVVEPVLETSVPTSFSDDRILLLMQCLQRNYRDYVEFDFDGATCQQIRLDDRLLKIEGCPTMRETKLLAKERPGLVVVK